MRGNRPCGSLSLEGGTSPDTTSTGIVSGALMVWLKIKAGRGVLRRFSPTPDVLAPQRQARTSSYGYARHLPTRPISNDFVPRR
jgi:hypothetical protein